MQLGDLSQRSSSYYAGKILPGEFRQSRNAGFLQIGLNEHPFAFQQGAEAKDLLKHTVD